MKTGGYVGEVIWIWGFVRLFLLVSWGVYGYPDIMMDDKSNLLVWRNGLVIEAVDVEV
jgi:hypothetical protein